jgi:hypothetical protein
MAARPGKWRVLAVFCGPSLDNAFAEIGSNLGCVAEILEKPLPFVEVVHPAFHQQREFVWFDL